MVQDGRTDVPRLLAVARYRLAKLLQLTSDKEKRR